MFAKFIKSIFIGIRVFGYKNIDNDNNICFMSQKVLLKSMLIYY